MSGVKDTIKLLNPWWDSGTVSDELSRPYKRIIFNKIDELHNYRQIVVLSGLRRVGKTTILYQAINELLKKIEPKNIFYFSFDKDVEGLIDLLEAYKELTNVDYK